MIFKDYYKILGLETNKVTSEEIKIAYREQAKKYHPDVNIGDKRSEERFKDINEAYKLLSQAQSKRKYDRQWNNYIGRRKAKENNQTEKETASNEIFSMFFGSGEKEQKTENKKTKKVPAKGENIETEISVSIEEAYFGSEKRISLRAIDGKMKTFAIKVPSGIRNNEKVRLIGQGKSGINGGKNGDLFIRINIKDDLKFKISGNDLVTDLYLSPWEAALGTRVNLDGIDEKVSLYIPPGILSGEKVKIPQKGYKDGKGGRGDLVAEVKTVVPRKLAENEKELFERLSEISKFNPRRD